MAEKVAAKSRTGIGTFFFAPESHFPLTAVPILGEKAQTLHGQFSKKTIDPAAQPRFACAVHNSAVPPDPVRRRFLTRRSTGGRSYAPRKLPQTTTTTTTTITFLLVPTTTTNTAAAAATTNIATNRTAAGEVDREFAYIVPCFPPPHVVVRFVLRKN